jgi:hypothetical protein
MPLREAHRFHRSVKGKNVRLSRKLTAARLAIYNITLPRMHEARELVMRKPCQKTLLGGEGLRKDPKARLSSDGHPDQRDVLPWPL